MLVYAHTQNHGWQQFPAERLIVEARRGRIGRDLPMRSLDGRLFTMGELLDEVDRRTKPKPKVPGWVKLAGIAAAAAAGKYVYERMTTTTEQRSIKESVKRHQQNGADFVCGDHIGMGCRPPKMNGRHADVFAVYGNDFFVEEHETKESARRTHSVRQDRDLKRFAQRHAHVFYTQVIAGK